MTICINFVTRFGAQLGYENIFYSCFVVVNGMGILMVWWPDDPM